MIYIIKGYVEAISCIGKNIIEIKFEGQKS